MDIEINSKPQAERLFEAFNLSLKQREKVMRDRIAGLFILVLIIPVLLFAAQAEIQNESKIVSFQVLAHRGGRLSWLKSKGLIAYDAFSKDGYTDVYIMDSEGKNKRCLTCDNPQVASFHNGNPEWHPNGEFILFQSQNPNLEKPTYLKASLYRSSTSPGAGVNNDLWLMTKDGSKVWKLTNIGKGFGLIHPHFSPDGKRLAWSEMTRPIFDSVGEWAIKLADFEFSDGAPRLKNIKTLKPANQKFYEVQSFSSDGKKIIFSAVPYGRGIFYYEMDNYLFDLETGSILRLTNDDDWDEFGQFVNNDRQIIWSSSSGIPQEKTYGFAQVIKSPPKLDYWIMDVDGTNRRRLTRFNDPDSQQYIKNDFGVGLADFEASSDGKIIIGKMRLKDRSDSIAKVEFK